MQGVDFAFSRPSPQAIRAAGYGFVARYYSSAPAKKLTRVEADGYVVAGLKIVTVWEDGGTDALLGLKAGLAAGAQAAAQGASCAQPPRTAIYAAVDFDAQPSQLPQVVAYLRAFAGACLPYQGGAYGGLAVVQAAQEAGIVWLWQTEAWSGGHVLPGAHLLQHARGATVAGCQVDVNDALLPLFGAWPTPAPDPVPNVPDIGAEDMENLVLVHDTRSLVWRLWNTATNTVVANLTGNQPAVTSFGQAGVKTVEWDGADSLVP